MVVIAMDDFIAIARGCAEWLPLLFRCGRHGVFGGVGLVSLIVRRVTRSY
jgi:hypothetical protein